VIHQLRCFVNHRQRLSIYSFVESSSTVNCRHGYANEYAFDIPVNLFLTYVSLSY
jgi:hypothetical protein